MKSIVQEVLKPANKPKENPLFDGETKYIYSKSIVNTTAKTNDQPPIQGIDRPNYQKKNIQKRLAGIPVKPTANIASTSPIPAPRKSSSANQINKDFVTGSLSKLQTISLVQGNQPKNSSYKNSPASKHSFHEQSQFIGETKNGTKAWIFPCVHHQILEVFQRPLKTNSIGVISCERSTMGQLFLTNEVLREFSSLKYNLIWDKDQKNGFVIELYEENTDRLSNAVKTMFQKLSQYSFKQIQTFKVQSPSPWLTKQLNLTAQVDGAAVIEGIDKYSSVHVLDRYLKQSPSDHFSFKIERNFILLYGKYDIVSKAADELQKQAEKIK